MKNSIIDFSQLPVEEQTAQHINGRLAFLSREIKHFTSEIERLEEERMTLIKELHKRLGGQNNV